MALEHSQPVNASQYVATAQGLVRALRALGLENNGDDIAAIAREADANYNGLIEIQRSDRVRRVRDHREASREALLGRCFQNADAVASGAHRTQTVQERSLALVL